MTTQTFDAAGAANSTGTGSGFDVWDGTYANPDNPAPHYGHQTQTPNAPSPNMVDAATYAPEHLQGLSHDQLKALQEQLYQANYLPKAAVTGEMNGDTKSGYNQFLTDVSLEGARSGPITPNDYMAKILGPKGAGAGQDSTSTSTSVASPQDARALALTTFQSLLGRRPSQHEMDAFYNALTAYDRANPTVNTQTTQTAGGNSSTSLSTGGANDQAFAQSYVDQNFGGQEGQHSALHYFDLVNSALTGPPPGVTHAV